MPVIVLTTKEPPPPPPTGFGGNLFLPGAMFGGLVIGSLRETDDVGENVPAELTDEGILGSLRSTEDTATMNVNMNDLDNEGSLRAYQDIPGTIPNSAGNLVGSPNLGDF